MGWHHWGSCTKCSGQKFRTRTVKSYNANGGKPCEPGAAREVAGCDERSAARRSTVAGERGKSGDPAVLFVEWVKGNDDAVWWFHTRSPTPFGSRRKTQNLRCISRLGTASMHSTCCWPFRLARLRWEWCTCGERLPFVQFLVVNTLPWVARNLSNWKHWDDACVRFDYANG